MKKFVFVAASALVASAAFAGPFGAAGDYNVFVGENFNSSNSDTEGRLGAGGSVTLNNYDVGLGNPGGPVLSAGTDLIFNNGTVRGDAYYGSSYSANNLSYANGGAPMLGSPIDANGAYQSLVSLSAYMSGLQANGSTSKPYSTILLQGSDSDLNIFDLDANMLGGASDINIIIPDGASAVVNVSGSSVNLPNFGYNINGSQDPEKFRKVIWHLKDAQTVSMSSLNGTFFAPNAAVQGSYGAVNGQFFAKSFDGHTQFNWQSYNGTEAVPEPASMIGLIAGIGALAAFRRKKKA